MRLVLVLLQLVLATVVVTLTIALLSADTGFVEKVVLVGMIAGCVYLAACVPTFIGRVQARLQRS
jgi:hypothetical protein